MLKTLFHHAKLMLSSVSSASQPCCKFCQCKNTLPRYSQEDHYCVSFAYLVHKTDTAPGCGDDVYPLVIFEPVRQKSSEKKEELGICRFFFLSKVSKVSSLF